MSEPTLSELRALDENNCQLWTPRDLLMHLLREMDSGDLRPDGMLVCFMQKEGENTRTGMRRSRCTVVEAVGMCEVAKFDLLETTRS